MKVFKFGGASVKDALGVKNLLSVIKTVGHKDTLVVVSAMGKTTNALEKIIDDYFKEKDKTPEEIYQLKEFHLNIIKDLFEKNSSEIEKRIHEIFDELIGFLNSNKSPNYSFVYDQVVSYGEILSTKIIHHFIEFSGIDNFWLDSRNCIKTDDYYRAANLNWELTQKILNSK